jgi:hypothetical protein
VGAELKLLEEIRSLPDPVRRKLEAEFGIDSAESFFAHALDNPAAMAQALGTVPAEVERLIGLVEGYLPADYRERCLKPVRRPRGLIVDPPRRKRPQQ